MTTMTQERTEPGGAPAKRTRPASGIVIDGHKLMAWRARRAMSRQDLSDAIAALKWRYPSGSKLTLGRDAIAKLENGYRKPKALTLRALCTALTGDGEVCTPAALMPDGEPLPLPLAAQQRQLRLDYYEALRKFAAAHGIGVRSAGSNRLYYPRFLQDAFAQYVLDQAVGGKDQHGFAELAREQLEKMAS